MKKEIITVILLTLLILVGVTVFIFLVYNRPPQRALFIKPIYHLNTTDKVVALTFDDGPSATWTPAVLDVLKEHQVKAAFFMLGQNIEKNPSLTQRVVTEGHLIGNHSYSHPRLIFKTPWYITDQLEKTDQLIQSAGQSEVTYFRPPYDDKMVILPLVLNKMHKSLVTFDTQAMTEYDRQNTDSSKIVNEIIYTVQPGSVIILHDGREGDSTTFITAVDQIITKLKADGYRFVTINEVI